MTPSLGGQPPPPCVLRRVREGSGRGQGCWGLTPRKTWEQAGHWFPGGQAASPSPSSSGTTQLPPLGSPASGPSPAQRWGATGFVFCGVSSGNPQGNLPGELSRQSPSIHTCLLRTSLPVASPKVCPALLAAKGTGLEGRGPAGTPVQGRGARNQQDGGHSSARVVRPSPTPGGGRDFREAPWHPPCSPLSSAEAGAGLSHPRPAAGSQLRAGLCHAAGWWGCTPTTELLGAAP